MMRNRGQRTVTQVAATMKRELLPLDVRIDRLLKWLERIQPLPAWNRKLILANHAQGWRDSWQSRNVAPIWVHR